MDRWDAERWKLQASSSRRSALWNSAHPHGLSPLFWTPPREKHQGSDLHKLGTIQVHG